MRIELRQTGSNDDLGEQQCCICRGRFYLGAATCFAISERSNILWGEVCPACIERGPEYIQCVFDRKACWSRMSARIDTETAEEGVSDCPTLDEILTAEAFYERPMFETGEEFGRALARGEID